MALFRKKQKQRLRGMPKVLSVLLIILVLLGNLLVLLIGGFLIDTVKSVMDMTDIVISMENSITETMTYSSELTDFYKNSKWKNLSFAASMFEEGLFEYDLDNVNRILNGKEFFFLDNNGNLIGGNGTCPRSGKDIIKVIHGDGNDQGLTFIDADDFVYYQKINEDMYAISFGDFDEEISVDQNIRSFSDLIWESETDESFAILASNGFASALPRSLGKYQSAKIDSFMQTLNGESVLDESGARTVSVIIEGKIYFGIVRELNDIGEGTELYYFFDLITMVGKAMIIQMIVFMATLFFAAIIIYYVYQYRKINGGFGRFDWKDFCSKVVYLLLISTVLTGVAAYYSRTIYSFSYYVLNNDEQLSNINEEYQNSLSMTEALKAKVSEIYSDEIQMVGRYLSIYPQKRTEETLKELSEQFGMEYLILFDQEGNEVMTNADYINLSLSSKKTDVSCQFRSLLNGVTHLTTDIVEDDLTNRTHLLAGAGLRTLDMNPDGLVMAGYDTDVLEKAVASSSLKTIIDTSPYTGHNSMFLVNTETGKMEYSKNEWFVGTDAKDAGFTDEILTPGYSGSAYINGEKYSVTQFSISDTLYLYIAMRYEQIFETRNYYVIFVILCSAFHFLLYAFITGRMKLKPVEKQAEEETEEKKKCSPEEKTTRMIVTLARIFGLILAIVLIFRNRLLSSTSMIRYVMDGGWRYGLNVFALTAVLIMILLTTIVVELIHTLLNLLIRVVSPLAETYIRLLISTINYVSVLAVAYIAFTFFGVKMETLLATSSIMVLIISMGAQDLTADIIAGFFLMFESEFEVGDVINVNGTIGRVSEIGIHATKLIDENNNILILSNSNVKNIINLTKHHSLITESFTVSANIPIQKLEDIFKEELPLLKNTYPYLINDPYFNGISKFNNGMMECSVTAEINDHYKETMERKLLLEIQRILSQNGIEIGGRG